MWLSRLPDPKKVTLTNETPSFSENILFAEKTRERYSCPEHTCSFGLISLLNGHGQFAVNRRQEKLDKEKFLVINFNSRLSMDIPANDTDARLLFFQSQLPDVVAGSLTKTGEQLLDDPASNDHPVDFALLERLHGMNESLRNKLSLLTELGGSSSSFAALKADIIVRSILEDLVIKNNLAGRESLHIHVKKSSTRIELYKRLYTAKDWIEGNYHLPLTLNHLAAVACMNSQHFLRTFKQLFSVTPHQYIMNIRLENAKRLLLTTNDPVHVICRNTGLESLSSFSGLFKQRFAVAPSHFRNNPG
ncbi:MAG TPA: AraC family transcriptional regulator [Chitinophagaceae bacterium]